MILSRKNGMLENQPERKFDPMRKLEQGDIIWIDFDPQAGHEESKRRPALVVSGQEALALIKGLALVCPISSRSRPFPTHVILDGQTDTSGLILCEQVKALDINARNGTFIEKAPKEIVAEVINIIHSMLD